VVSQREDSMGRYLNEIKEIRERTRTGRPLGTNDFIEMLEGQLKRLLKLRSKGRPKKKVDK